MVSDRYEIGDREGNDLEKLLLQELEKPGLSTETTVILNFMENARHQYVNETIKKVRSLGFNNVSLKPSELSVDN